MPQLRPQVIDGLWQCLCPSFDQTVLRLSSGRLSTGSLAHQKHRLRRPFTIVSSRSIVTIIPSHPAVPAFWKPKHTGGSAISSEEDKLSLQHWRTEVRGEQQAPQDQASVQGVQTSRVLLDSSSNDIRTLTTSRIHAILRSDANNAYLDRVQEIVEILIRERGERPDKIHYSALISAQANADHGSAAEVERLLQEMKQANIELDAGIYRAVLKALAVHPHYMLRCHVVQQMEKSWYALDKDDQQHIIAGLLRDLQFELAWDRLNSLEALGFTPEPWLLNLFIFSFSSIQCLPEAHDLLKTLLLNSGYRVPGALWSYLLHTATREQYQPMIRDIWNRAVKIGYINPSSGLCTAVLESCAAHGDTILAADVFQILSKRSSPLQISHYECLLEAYIVSGDLKGLLSTIKIMSKAGFPLGHASTRSIFTYLRQSEEMVNDVLGLISQPKRAKKSMPLAFINTVLEAMTHQGNLSAAVDILHELDRLTPEPADCETFNVLLQGCTFTARKDIAMSLASEMREKGIIPNALTYDRLILVCLSTKNIEDFKDAWRYYDEFRSSMAAAAPSDDQRWTLRRGTVRSIIARCIQHRDLRALSLLDAYEREGIDVGILRQSLEKDWHAKWGHEISQAVD